MSEAGALVLFGAGADAARQKMVIVRNKFSNQEQEEPYHEMVRDICSTTLKRRFCYRTFYKDFKAVISKGPYVNKHRIYMCKNALTGNPVALKVKVAGDDADREREFNYNMYEVYFCNRLCRTGNPHVVQLQQVWANSRAGEVYLEMEQCGPNLESLVTKHASCMPLSLAIPLLKQALRALYYCHQNCVIHGDVKPANFVLNPERTGAYALKLCDFDMARETAHPLQSIPLETNTNDRRMLPLEILLRYPSMSAAVDIFALGCTLVKMVGGNPALFETLDWQEQLNYLHRAVGPVTPDHLAAAHPESTLTLPTASDSCPEFDTVQNLDPLLPSLLARMLHLDATLRITAFAALHHPLFYKIQ